MRFLIVRLATMSLLSACAHTSAPEASAPAPSAEARLLARQAHALLRSDKPAEALPLYRSAWEQGVRHSGTLYDAACAAALQGERAEALTWLERAAEAGFSQSAHMQEDPDLASVREEPAFTRLVERVAANEAKLLQAQEPELRDELLRMMQEDQAARREAAMKNFQSEEANERLRAVDGRTTARMKEIIAQVGWPTRTLVSPKGAKAAWLLVQHADQDLPFQKECLALLEKAVAANEAEGRDLAYLTDRVRVAEGRPQRYGTQFHQVDGKLVPHPIEDEAHVDERRAAVGLGSLAEYTEHLRRMASSGDR